MPWTIPVPILPDESISSWLARAALRQGCDPLTLTGSIWPGWRVWTLDIDRGIPHDRMPAILKASGLTANDFENIALRQDAERIAGCVLAETIAWPWILALGSRNRKRRGGQQYCPVCLQEDAKPYFRKKWRFAWYVGCEQHLTKLVDRCCECGAPVEPHRLSAEDGHIAKCARCKTELYKASPQSIPNSALALQRMADETLNNFKGTFGSRFISCPDWFGFAHYFFAVIRIVSRRKTSRLAQAFRLMGLEIDEEVLPVTGLPLELLSVDERKVLSEITYHLLKSGSEVIIEAFIKAGVTSTSLRNRKSKLPKIIEEMFSNLSDSEPVLKKRHRKPIMCPRSKKAVMAAWLRFQRKILAESI